MKWFCADIREHALNTTNHEKKKMKPLTKSLNHLLIKKIAIRVEKNLLIMMMMMMMMIIIIMIIIVIIIIIIIIIIMVIMIIIIIIRDLSKQFYLCPFFELRLSFRMV